MNIGILTGGGDCPGLNAVIRGVTRRGIQKFGDSIVGILDVEGQDPGSAVDEAVDKIVPAVGVLAEQQCEVSREAFAQPDRVNDGNTFPGEREITLAVGTLRNPGMCDMMRQVVSRPRFVSPAVAGSMTQAHCAQAVVRA